MLAIQILFAFFNRPKGFDFQAKQSREKFYPAIADEWNKRCEFKVIKFAK
jgi:hypothetical protein